MEPIYDPNAHLISRRALLWGAAGVGLAVAAGGALLPACGFGGGGESKADGPDADGPLETTSIRLFSHATASCIAAQYMAEPSLGEEGFTDVQNPRYTVKDTWTSLADGAIDFGDPAFLMPMIADGAPITLLGGVHVGCWQVIATGDIKTMRDFKGKTVAVSAPNFTDGIFMTMTLANVGLDSNKDVTVVIHPPSEYARLLSSGEIDGAVAIPPVSTDLRAKGIGHVVVNSVADPPWSNYYCCVPIVNRDWMKKHPVAAKRALRAMLKGADTVAKDVEGTARHMVNRGYANNYDYTCDSLRELPYNVWRDYDPVDSVRFYALRLKEAGLLESTPEAILKRGTDFRYFNQLKQELQNA